MHGEIKPGNHNFAKDYICRIVKLIWVVMILVVGPLASEGMPVVFP